MIFLSGIFFYPPISKLSYKKNGTQLKEIYLVGPSPEGQGRGVQV